MRRQQYIAVMLIWLIVFPSTRVWAEDPEPQEQQAQAQAPAQAQGEQGTKPPPPQEPEQVVRPSETASTPSTGRKILTNFWTDQKAMWTSPFHMNRDNAKWWGLFA